MSESKKIQAVKGVRDILPPESALWSRVENTAREVFASYNFGEIRVPVLEQADLFARAVGADTEIVSKEMFTFADRPAGLPDPRDRILPAEELQVLEDAMSSGELPSSESNRTIILGLKQIVYKMDAAQNDTAGTTNSLLAEFRKLASDYVFQAHFIHLGDMLTLRPEATASVVRAYIEHGMHTLPGDVKLYYIGPMFRRERPQKGRFRQFYQIGAEILGQSDRPAIDAELIEMLLVFIARCGLKEHRLYINSIGCRNCRPAYVEKLRAALAAVKDKLGPDSQRRIETNPLRVLDSKRPEEQAIIETLPRLSAHFCQECAENFTDFRMELKMRNIAYQDNWRLVRGLDYYTRTTFEVTAPGLGSQDAICGGGRYDGLVQLLGGPPTKGIGFALGTDRLILALEEAGAGGKIAGIDVFVAWYTYVAYPMAARVARRLREAGFSVEMVHEDLKFKKSLGLADRMGARFVLLIGENEVAGGACTVKRLADGTQEIIAEAALVEHLKAAYK